jgi:hypothetical protein
MTGAFAARTKTLENAKIVSLFWLSRAFRNALDVPHCVPENSYDKKLFTGCCINCAYRELKWLIRIG